MSVLWDIIPHKAPSFAFEWNQRRWPGVGSEDPELDTVLTLAVLFSNVV